MKTKQALLSAAILVAVYVLTVGYTSLYQEKWVAPKSTDDIVNPLKDDTSAAASGKKLYKALCVICHGAKGKGDGMAGAGISPRPTKFTTDEFQSQSDGAIFWKLTEGRTPMALYKETLSEEKRWL